MQILPVVLLLVAPIVASPAPQYTPGDLSSIEFESCIMQENHETMMEIIQNIKLKLKNKIKRALWGTSRDCMQDYLATAYDTLPTGLPSVPTNTPAGGNAYATSTSDYVEESSIPVTGPGSPSASAGSSPEGSYATDAPSAASTDTYPASSPDAGSPIDSTMGPTSSATKTVAPGTPRSTSSTADSDKAAPSATGTTSGTGSSALPSQAASDAAGRVSSFWAAGLVVLGAAAFVL